MPNSLVKTTEGKIGLPEGIYTLKPAKKSNFDYSYNREEFKQPENIIEEVREIVSNLFNKVRYLGQISNVS